MAVMAVKAAGLTGTSRELTFADTKDISDWASEAVAIATGRGIMKGYPVKLRSSAMVRARAALWSSRMPSSRLERMTPLGEATSSPLYTVKILFSNFPQRFK